MARSDRSWQELGEKEPYFAVLTSTRYLSSNLDDQGLKSFFASGKEDVATLLSWVTEAGGSGHPSLALDFGCGLGRLTLPLAERADKVIGVDVATSMLERAEAIRRERDVRNVRFLPTSSMSNLEVSSFDYVQSLIVFQHMPVDEGERRIGELIDLLQPGGSFALHVLLERPGGPIRQMLRALRARVPLIHQAASLLKRGRMLPYMQMNTYDEERVTEIIRSHGGEVASRHPTDHGGFLGVILVGRAR